MDIGEAVRQFRVAAPEKGDAAESAKDDHRLHAMMADAWRRLHGLGGEGRAAFKALLDDDSRHVRCWVAAQLLALGDESGVQVLQADASAGGVCGFSSEMVLQEWKTG